VTSPLVTMVVLAVLWLVVVVPMILQRKDERADERSVQRFSRAMSLLSSKRAFVARRVADPADPGDATMVLARTGPSEPEVFVSGEHPAPSPEVARRRPVPVAKEALMHPVDRSEMSAARIKMLARRRRSLATLGAGTLLSLILVVVMGGAFSMVLLVLFAAGLGGYLWFLRTQAQRDAARRANRLSRATFSHREDSHDAFDRSFAGRFDDTVVALDDDDPQFDHLDTVDLTGLYVEELEPMQQRRSA
jgi:uncharacterized membrane protein